MANPFTVIYTTADGDVKLVYPAPGVTREALLAKLPPGAFNVVVTDQPVNRTFRKAWESDPVTGFRVNLDKAKEIVAARLHAARREAARELAGREFLGDDVTAQKGRLRSIDPDALVAGASDPDALAAVPWPADLPKRKGA